MSRRKRRAEEPEEAEEQPDEPSEASLGAGACVLVVLGAGATAGAFAASPTVGVFGLWVVGTGSLWWSCRRSMRRTANPAPPPVQKRPSCSECAGHTLIEATPLSGAQKGMLIYKSAPADRPNHTHIHLVRETS